MGVPPKERGIIFSTPLVPKLLDDSKTQTRRLVKTTVGSLEKRLRLITHCPYGLVGDRLWVRETFIGGRVGKDNESPPEPSEDWVLYRADNPPLVNCGWRPSIHMPRWASRITLEITSVRVQRLMDITEEDAIAEGATWTDYGRICHHRWDEMKGPCPAPAKQHPQRDGWSMFPTTSAKQCLSSARNAFANTWNRIHGGKNWNLTQAESPWDLNPWVWAISFRRIAQRRRAHDSRY